MAIYEGHVVQFECDKPNCVNIRIVELDKDGTRQEAAVIVRLEGWVVNGSSVCCPEQNHRATRGGSR